MPPRADGPHPAAPPTPPTVDYDSVAHALAGGLARLWRARRPPVADVGTDSPAGPTREPSPGPRTKPPRRAPAPARRAPAA